MDAPQPPPSPPKFNPLDPANDDAEDEKSVTNGAPLLGEGSKKKSRLQWDEENLMLNAAEMERAGPRMKIDEPKTPFNNGSENGSSTSGSAHQSPPESPSFIPRDHLVGFGALEQRIGRASTGNVSDGASTGSVGSTGRSVHISDDNLATSAGSSPRSREVFAARRKAHYRNEARVNEWFRLNELEEDEEGDNGNATVDHPNHSFSAVSSGAVSSPPHFVRHEMDSFDGDQSDEDQDILPNGPDGAHSANDDKLLSPTQVSSALRPDQKTNGCPKTTRDHKDEDDGE